MIDRYTKFVLTVIACSLTSLVIENLVGTSQAQFSQPQKVQICGDTFHCLDLGIAKVKFMGSQNVITYGLPVVLPDKD